jgi:hypothetical protein
MPCWPCRNPELAEQHDCKGHQVCAEPQSRPRWGPESNAMHGDSWVLSPWPPMQTAPVSAAYRSNLHRNGGGGSSSAVHTAVAASTSLDSHIRVWNVETGQADKVFDCGPGAACHISCACKMRIRRADPIALQWSAGRWHSLPTPSIWLPAATVGRSTSGTSQPVCHTRPPDVSYKPLRQATDLTPVRRSFP